MRAYACVLHVVVQLLTCTTRENGRLIRAVSRVFLGVHATVYARARGVRYVCGVYVCVRVCVCNKVGVYKWNIREAWGILTLSVTHSLRNVNRANIRLSFS